MGRSVLLSTIRPRTFTLDPCSVNCARRFPVLQNRAHATHRKEIIPFIVIFFGWYLENNLSRHSLKGNYKSAKKGHTDKGFLYRCVITSVQTLFLTLLNKDFTQYNFIRLLCELNKSHFTTFIFSSIITV